MKYDHYQYLYPPRPESAQPAWMIPTYVRQGWFGQIKLNGTCSILAVDPAGRLHTANRHHEAHKLWAPISGTYGSLQKLPGRGWHVFVGEILDAKTPHIKQTTYLFDLLVADGEYLIGHSFADRYDRMFRIFQNRLTDQGDLSHYQIEPKLWLARNLSAPEHRLSAVFANLSAPEDEGLVLKDPKAKLEFCLTERSNRAGMVKVRRPHKNYDC